jgi:hypothetical protein
LQQELILWRLPYFSVEKNDLDACSDKLFQQEHLMGVVACKPIWAMHIQAIDPACRRDVTETFESRTDEGGPAVAVVHKLQLSRKRDAFGRQASSQICQLTLNCPGFVLLV